MLDKNFKKRIEELRIKRGYTKTKVADAIGISVPAYYYFERGTKEPSVNTIKKLAELYSVSTDYLIYGTEKSNNNIDLKKADVLSYDGKPISDEELEIIKAILNRHGISK